MKRKRILPCLDVQAGKVVKGKKFQDVQEIADPLTLAKRYVDAGADELVLYHIADQQIHQASWIQFIKDVAQAVSVPLTVGGGLYSIETIEEVFKAGAQKVSLNSVLLNNPQFLAEAVAQFGGERIVVSMDVSEVSDGVWKVFRNGGRDNTEIDAVTWAQQCEATGAGELVINSIDGDGVKNGYDLQLMQRLREAVDIPLIASGGAGEMVHFRDAFTIGKADGALAASVFHYNEIDIGELKQYLRQTTNA